MFIFPWVVDICGDTYWVYLWSLPTLLQGHDSSSLRV